MLTFKITYLYFIIYNIILSFIHLAVYPPLVFASFSLVNFNLRSSLVAWTPASLFLECSLSHLWINCTFCFKGVSSSRVMLNTMYILSGKVLKVKISSGYYLSMILEESRYLNNCPHLYSVVMWGIIDKSRIIHLNWRRGIIFTPLFDALVYPSNIFCNSFLLVIMAFLAME